MVAVWVPSGLASVRVYAVRPMTRSPGSGSGSTASGPDSSVLGAVKAATAPGRKPGATAALAREGTSEPDAIRIRASAQVHVVYHQAAGCLIDIAQLPCIGSNTASRLRS